MLPLIQKLSGLKGIRIPCSNTITRSTRSMFNRRLPAVHFPLVTIACDNARFLLPLFWPGTEPFT